MASERKIRKVVAAGADTSDPEPVKAVGARRHARQPRREELSPQQLRAIAALISKQTLAEAAKEVGVHPRTLSRWFDERPFAEEYRRQIEILGGDLSRQLIGLRDDAVRRLRQLMDSSNERVALRVVLWLLDGMSEISSTSDRDQARDVGSVSPHLLEFLDGPDDEAGAGGRDVAERSLETLIDVFEHEIAWSQSAGRPGDWGMLRRRLDRLSSRRRAQQREETNLHPLDRARRIEHAAWATVLCEVLDAEVLAKLVRVLGEDPVSVDPRVWVVLDRPLWNEEVSRADRAAVSARAEVAAALSRHAVEPRHARIVEGLRALEDLVAMRSALQPTFPGEALVAEGNRLVEALEDLLPPLANRLLSFEVEGRCHAELVAGSADEPSGRVRVWYQMLPGVERWSPTWERLSRIPDTPDPAGVWFTPSYQATYEAANRELEGRRRKRLKAEERRRELEEADRRAEQRRREEDVARLRAEELQRQEDERRHLAEAEAAANERRLEELRRVEAQAVRKHEAERARYELARQELAERMPPPAPAPRKSGWIWERTPEEIRQSWVEREWLKWCKSRGVSPEEVDDATRERFFRHF